MLNDGLFVGGRQGCAVFAGAGGVLLWIGGLGVGASVLPVRAVRGRVGVTDREVVQLELTTL